MEDTSLTTALIDERNTKQMELSRRYLAKAEENERQAESLRRKTTRARWNFLPFIGIALLVLAIWTASVFVSIGAPWGLALPLSLVLHAGLALAIHTACVAWSRGQIGRAFGTGMMALLLILAFVGIACFRAIHSIEDGNNAFMSWLMAAIYSCLETCLPIALGAEYAHRCQDDEAATEDRDFYKKLASDIREDMVDAPGIWDDHEASLEAQIREMRHQDTGTPQERKRIDHMTRRLRRLRESHPGKRFRDLIAKAPAHATEFADLPDPAMDQASEAKPRIRISSSQNGLDSTRAGRS